MKIAATESEKRGKMEKDESSEEIGNGRISEGKKGKGSREEYERDVDYTVARGNLPGGACF